jgi:hypothetical protein
MEGDGVFMEGDYKTWDKTVTQEAYNNGVAPVLTVVARRMGWKKTHVS